jgi:Tfp pilus assembly protein PilX
MRARGFTFVEVLAILLVLAMGFTSAVLLARYGQRLTQEAIAASLAMPTARSAMIDARQDGSAVGEWTAAATTWSGYINGLYVRRTLTDKVVTGAITFATVTVEVFWSGEGDKSLSITERLAFHAP